MAAVRAVFGPRRSRRLAQIKHVGIPANLVVAAVVACVNFAAGAGVAALVVLALGHRDTGERAVRVQRGLSACTRAVV